MVDFALQTECDLDVDSLFAPLRDSADRFAAAARKFLQDMQTPDPTAGAAAARTFGDFLRVETMELIRFPWSADFGSGAAAASRAAMQEPPALGPNREHQLRWQRTADTARRIVEAQHRLQLLWSDALRDAAIAFAARLQPPQPGAAKGAVPDIEALREIYDSWIECAEESYARTAHGDLFGSALADFMNASSAWRKETQANIELWAKALDLPTRSELNTLTRRVTSLEEQLRLKQPRDSAQEDSPRQELPRKKPPRARRPSRPRRGKRP